MAEPPKQIFTYHDGSALIIMRASEIAQMDVWNGNRILDFQHCLKTNTYGLLYEVKGLL